MRTGRSSGSLCAADPEDMHLPFFTIGDFFAFGKQNVLILAVRGDYCGLLLTAARKRAMVLARLSSLLNPATFAQNSLSKETWAFSTTSLCSDSVRLLFFVL